VGGRDVSGGEEGCHCRGRKFEEVGCASDIDNGASFGSVTLTVLALEGSVTPSMRFEANELYVERRDR